MSDLMDNSLEAIRRRAAESVTWPNRELAAATGREAAVDQTRSDVLWRAVQDRRILLERLDELLLEDVEAAFPPAEERHVDIDDPLGNQGR